MGKRLCSLLLLLTMMGSSMLALAADQTAAAVSSTSSAAAEDPQAYREQHPKTVTQEEKSISSVMLFANSTIKSIYTGNTYVVPAGKQITQGIDVSKWDSTINWTKVKNAGTDFAIIRVGYRGYSNGAVYADPTYTTNIAGANQAGVPAGVYFYSQATTAAEAREEAQYCIEKVRGYKIQLPIVMDLEFAEDSSGYMGRLYKKKLSKAAQTEICLAFCDTVRSAGYTPMIYANAYMLTEHTNASQLSAACKIWMASFPTRKTNQPSSTTYTTKYTGDYDIWQYSEWGNVAGITPVIDCNFGIGLNIAGGETGDGITDATNTPSAPEEPSTPVKPAEVAVESVSLNVTTKTLAAGSSSTFRATVAPSNAADAVTWSSSDTSVATVSSSGKVTAKAPGTATITASAGGKSAVCMLTVNPRKPVMKEIRSTSSGVVLYWNTSQGSQKYAVYRSSNGASGSYTLLGTSTSATYTDKTASSSKTYYYRIAGQATVSGTTYTGNKTAATGTASIPARTSITSLKQLSDRRTRLIWSSVKGASKYYIFRSTSGKTGTFKRIKTVTGTSYTSGKMTKGKRYYYRIVPVRTISSILYRGRVSTTKNIRIQ